ncbi:hypothetical protein ACFYTQ_01740 [Nocardia sp. NPDC004068]|uniref:hypothetical protein n=1 Tax=Nocardia sp. NPDC004068 TaxID=3364303 RepID=UPI0036CD51A1
MIKPILGLVVALTALTGCATSASEPSQTAATTSRPSTVTVTDGDRAFLTALAAKGGGLARLAVNSPYGAICTGRNLAEEFDRLVRAGSLPAQVFPSMVENFFLGDGSDQTSFTRDEVADMIRLAVSVYQPQYATDIR